MDLAIVVFSGYAAALIAPFLCRLTRKWSGPLLALVPFGMMLYFASLLPRIIGGDPVTAFLPWVPALGINLSFYVDGLSVLFALLITGIGALILLYAGSYLAKHPALGRFYLFILIFMASMLGVVLSNNLLLLFIFWELTSVSSYFLIGFDSDREEARAAALQALLVTSLGGLALLAGFLLMGWLGGTYNINLLAAESAALQANSFYVPILLLVLLGAFTKSAQFPFHFWLPNAMQAPTPVSAYLHSATMVKAGIYLLARLSPVLAGTDWWTWILESVGLVTMLLGAVIALQKTDLKQILAYSTISALGLLTLTLGVGSEFAITGAMLFLIAHALYKGTLFLVAGSIDHETGTREIQSLGGLRRAMPFTAIAALLAALSMATIPPLLGFLSKEFVYEATLHANAALLLTGAVFIASVCFVAIAFIVGYAPFFGARVETPKHAHEAPPPMLVGPVLLALLGLGLGLVPGLFDETLLSSAVGAVLASNVSLHLSLWHGVTPVLLLSIVTIASGIVLFLLRGKVRRALTPIEQLSRVGPARGYAAALRGLNLIAAAQTRWLQSGYLRHYLIIVIITLVALTGFTLSTQYGVIIALPPSDLRFYEAGLGVLILLAVMAVITTNSRLTAIAALGVVGYGVALIFLLYGAPDLAMTQFLIETLTVILFVLMFYRLPRFASLTPPPKRWRDIGIALLGGGLMSILVLVSISIEPSKEVSEYYLENSVVLTHGRNIVNTILVDWRAFDTLGEITVLSVAAIGVFALLKLRLAPRKDKS